ncbi:hypothetical protein [Pelomonas cellulosilytica]|uniref:Uncharacterized protein n=1 Tax=Pelomonas cellulosilytica TaxID=2906762 RepID=A0ABS8XZS3_9BURK|nr:hypothetical protein [Pelomonas sp. P8]MCE4557195.1 hypothetical protein [Pelomonas sp. P8]
MKTDAYTPDAICKSMGMPSFEEDPDCSCAAEAIRLLLKPSFHPEICITFADGKVSVVCARFMIWHQFEPSPMLTDRDRGAVPPAVAASLISSMTPVVHPGAVPGITIDGMPTDLLHFRSGSVALRVGGNAGRKGNFSGFIAQAIATAWEHISNPYCRNSLAQAGEYVNRSLPRDVEPPQRKPTIETRVLGSSEDRAELLAALKQHHDR